MDYVPAVSAQHYDVQECDVQQFAFKQELSATATKIIQTRPEVILGNYNLFNYSFSANCLSLDPRFQNLLRFLVDIGELNSSIFSAKSLDDINTIFQRTQGEGGLLRKEGFERWDLKDNEATSKNAETLKTCLESLGFMKTISLQKRIAVNHCIIFGATAMRLETRIPEVISYLRNGILKVTDHIFLLGSTRKLIAQEKTCLKDKVSQMPSDRQSYWQKILEKSEDLSEADACSFLWEYFTHLTPLPEQVDVVVTKSTRIGSSYSEGKGHRPTTTTTVEDWQEYYKIDEESSIFAFAEQPYMRLCDQFRQTTVTNAGKAEPDETLNRIRNTTFHFTTKLPEQEPLMSLYLDEIARNVYRVKNSVEQNP